MQECDAQHLRCLYFLFSSSTILIAHHTAYSLKPEPHGSDVCSFWFCTTQCVLDMHMCGTLFHISFLNLTGTLFHIFHWFLWQWCWNDVLLLQPSIVLHCTAQRESIALCITIPCCLEVLLWRDCRVYLPVSKARVCTPSCLHAVSG